MVKLEIVIPAYNEEKNIPELVSRVLSAAQKFQFSKDDFKLLLVNNGSTDQSQAVIEKILQDQKISDWVRAITIEKNQGYGFGILQGLRQTQAEWVGWTHADLQCDPANIFIGYLMAALQKDRPVLVKGRRKARHAKDRLVSQVFALMCRIFLNLKISELNAQPKIFHRDLLKKMINPPHDFALDLYLLYISQKSKTDVLEFDVYFPSRIHGSSKWAAHFVSRYKTIFKMLRYIIALSFKEGRL